METIDTAVDENAIDGNFTPTETAVLIYQRHRDKHPLSDAWTDEVEMVAGWERFGTWYVPKPAGVEGSSPVFVRYLQSESYVLELVFREYPVKNTVTGLQHLVGGFQAEIFRTDGAPATCEEAFLLTCCLVGPDFRILNGPADYRELDGSLTDRPLPTVEPGPPTTDSHKHLGLGFNMVLISRAVETATATGFANAMNLVPEGTPRVVKRNTQTDVKATILCNVERNLRKLRAIRNWIKCKLGLRHENLSPSSRDQYQAKANVIEARYGLRHVKSLAGLYRDRKGQHAIGSQEGLKLAEFHVEGRIAAWEAIKSKLAAISR